jgi:hypothetical protein
MLIARPTKHFAGIEIFGDGFDLRELYSVTSELMEKIDELHQEFLLSLNYEVRKAYNGDRESEVFGVDRELKYFGFKLLWPHFLFVIAQLRHLARWQPTTSRHHALLYHLEYVTEAALLSLDEKIGAEVVYEFRRLDQMPPDYLTSFIEHVNFDYACKGSITKLRFKRLPQLLRDLHWNSGAYGAYTSHIETLAKANSQLRTQIELDYPWTEFKW